MVTTVKRKDKGDDLTMSESGEEGPKRQEHKHQT